MGAASTSRIRGVGIRPSPSRRKRQARDLVRKWYSQFMTDVADIREDQVKARKHVTVEGPSVEELLAGR